MVKNADMYDARSGNMLIYIIGAIFLMGLLIVIVKGSFQPGTGIDPEKAQMAATQVRAQGAEFERAVNNIMRNGKSEADIRFSNTSDSAYGALTPPATYLADRQVFDIAGGGADYKTPPAGSQTVTAAWIYNATSAVVGIGTTGNTDDTVDLIAILPTVTKEVCLAVNNSAGVTNPSGNPPKEASSFRISTKFTGTFTFITQLDVTGDYLKGRAEGCLEGNDSSAGAALTGNYYYYKVLLAR